MEKELKEIASTVNNLDKLKGEDLKEKAQEYCKTMLQKFKDMQPELDYMSLKTEKRNLKKKGISVGHITDDIANYKAAAIYYAKDKKEEISELCRGYYDKVRELIPNTTEMVNVTRMAKIGGALKKMKSTFNSSLDELVNTKGCSSDDVVTFYKSFFEMIFDSGVKYSDIEVKKNQERKESLMSDFEKKIEDMASGKTPEESEKLTNDNTASAEA